MIQFVTSCACKGKEVIMTSPLLKKVVVACMLITSFVSAVPAAAQSQLGFYRSSRVLGDDTDTWRVYVPAGHPIRIVVDGNRRISDLDLRVFDGVSGALLAQDLDDTSYCIARFIAPYSGIIEIDIQNLGERSNPYTLSVRW
jgi:hypothetical protein